MRLSLGGWPTSILNEGFPAGLLTHDHIVGNYFGVLFMGSLLAWPPTLLLCLLVQRWRVCLYYLGIYALACFLCIGTMTLAPSQFLLWWLD